MFLYNYAAGLSLYMITQSFLGIFEIGVIKKLWPVDDTELPKKKKGFMTRLAEKQAEQMKRAQHMQDRTSATRSQAAKSRKRKKKSKR